MPKGADALSRSRIFNEWNDSGLPIGVTSAGTPMPLYVSGTGVLGVDLLSEAIAVSIENVHLKTITGATPRMDDTNKLAVSVYGATAGSTAGRTAMLTDASGAQYVWLASALNAIDDDVTVGMIAGVTPTMVNSQLIVDIKATPTIQRAAISVASSGDNTVVAAASGVKTKVLSCILVAAGDVDVRFESDAGGTALTGVMSLAADGNGFVLPPAMPGYHWMETAASRLLNLELSAAMSVAGCITYYQEA